MHKIAFLMMLLASSAAAAPPAPPNPADYDLIKAYIHAVETKNATALANTLADDVEVRSGPRVVASGRASWTTMVEKDFAAANLALKVEDAWYGISAGDRENAPTALLLEREDRVFGDCCVFHRSEVLTIRDHHIVRIDRSPSLAYQPTGTAYSHHSSGYGQSVNHLLIPELAMWNDGAESASS